MSKNIISSPHKHDGSSIRQTMWQLIVTLIPGLLLYIWFMGWAIVIQCLLAVGFALILESCMLKLRKLPVKLFLNDLSAVVTALLFALCLSPFTPWWINFFGIAFAIIVAKHTFGGLGNNLFNPAIAGYVFVLVSFPDAMLRWPLPLNLLEAGPELSDTLSIIFSGINESVHIDAFSSATPLNFLQSRLNSMSMISEIQDARIFGHIAGYGWEYINIAFFFGGICLLIKGIIKWHIPVTIILSIGCLSLLFHWYDPDVYASPSFHILSGATILTAFYIATDPVSSCSTLKGKIIYSVGIGFLAYIIRTWGAYPDGFAFSVLLMNATVPWLDSVTRPNVLGEEHGN